MNHPSIDLQGNVISAEVLDQLLMAEAQGQKPADFGLGNGTTVDRAIGEAWTTVRAKWRQFQEKRGQWATHGFTEARRQWLKPLFQELGYELESADPEQLEGTEKPYAITLRAEGLNGFPVHAIGPGRSLDERHKQDGRTQSAHALLQEYLNHSEHVYGLVTNGLQLRLLRDSTRLGKLAYVEFDLERILEQEIYPDFQALYRLLHASRMPRRAEATEESLIERYHQHGIESGSRIREKLRLEVKKAMEVLANGLLANNPAFAQAAVEGHVQAATYYQALLRVVYRMLFLIVIEERDLVHPATTGEDGPLARQRHIYHRYYSFQRLRKLALRASYVDGRRTDLWQGLLSTFRLFEGQGQALGIAPLGGDLFGQPLVVDGHDLHALKLDNHRLLQILSGLTLTRSEQGALVPVNYNDLDVEELGSIYEGLLELHPVLDTATGIPLFRFTAGSERKLTGSYYTRHDLVAQLIRTALLPVLEERLKGKRTPEEQAAAILGITVLDPACGSGHFLLAAARKLSERLAQVRTGDENPAKHELIAAQREVIARCVYGVDKNPAAIELCRLALWLEAHETGKPLTFLEHRIRCGDALVGVDRLERLREGIPDGAFLPVTGDDKPTADIHKKRNTKFRSTRQYGLFGAQLQLEADQDRFAARYRAVEDLKGDDLEARKEKETHYTKYRRDPGWWKDKVACDLYTYAFFQPYPEGLKENEVVDTELLLRQLNSAGSVQAAVEARAVALSERERFFHWPLEFPEVMAQGGFDVVLANPPWERVKLQEKEFFETRNEAVAKAPNAAARKRLIQQLHTTDPGLWREYADALRIAECSSKYIRTGPRYPLTGRGDVNTYSVFAELILTKLAPVGQGGFIVPTGIATDDGNKEFFGTLVEEARLVSLYDFENRKKIFPNVDSRFKFSLVTVGATDQEREASFSFFVLDVLDLNDPRRVFELTPDDFLRINPNTKTCPIFRTRQDADLTTKIYGRVPVLINEGLNRNPWGISFMRMFDMSNDSGLFRTAGQLRQQGFALHGNRFVKDEAVWLPLYESKMIWHYDHRYGSYERAMGAGSSLPTPELEEYQDSGYTALPRYWVKENEVQSRTDQNWFLGFRNITNITNERTGVFGALAMSGVGNSMPVIMSPLVQSEFLANTSCLPFDWFVRQKVAGSNMNFFYVQQFPVLSPNTYHTSDRTFIHRRVAELVYASWDIKAFADNLWREADAELRQLLRAQWEENRRATGGHGWVQPEWKTAYPEIDWAFEKGDEAGAEGGIPFPPFKWDEERRARLRAELDAYYALLYGLERDELRYILDPKEVHGEDFPGETFRVLKDKEIKQYGEYRTRRLVLEAYDHLRPTWDMPAHLGRLRVEYERLQQPVLPPIFGSIQEPKGKARKKANKGDQAPDGSTAQEPVATYQTGLFPEGGLFAAPEEAAGQAPAPSSTQAILAFLQAHPGLHGKAAILEGSGIAAKEWGKTIKALLDEGLVVQEGEKRGARYRLRE